MTSHKLKRQHYCLEHLNKHHIKYEKYGPTMQYNNKTLHQN